MQTLLEEDVSGEGSEHGWVGPRLFSHPAGYGGCAWEKVTCNDLLILRRSSLALGKEIYEGRLSGERHFRDQP
jgi:hypothetical protein